MSSAAAAPPAAAAAPAADADATPVVKKGKKKLIIIIAAAVLVLGSGAGAAAYVMNKRAAAAAAAAEEGGDEAAAEHGAVHVDPKHPPTFVPLDPFVVNLADKDADKYAQIGITLEIDDAHFADQLKVYMPAIRNGILMVLAHKTSHELLERAGKEALAAEILRESVRPLGIEVDEPEAPAHSAAAAPGDGASKPKAKPRRVKTNAEHNPVQRVHFSNFIIQ